MINRALSLCLLFGALCVLAGCNTVADNGRYAVSAMKAPFYKYGPAQAFGADFALVRGQHVTMVERGFGFSRVLTDDGVSGFVSTDDIASSPDPLPTKPRPLVASRRGGSSSGGSGGSGPRRKPAVMPEPDDGLFNVNDVPLPSDPEPPKKIEVQPPKPDAKPHKPDAKPEASPEATPNVTPEAKPATTAASKKKRRS